MGGVGCSEQATRQVTKQSSRGQVGAGCSMEINVPVKCASLKSLARRLNITTECQHLLLPTHITSYSTTLDKNSKDL